MNVKSFVIGLIVFTPLLMNGQIHFTDGMKWRTQVFGTHEPEGVTSIEVATIEKTSDDNCFNIYRTYEDNSSYKELIALIKTEDSKVLFKPKESISSEWYLLYDFSLKPGEGCFIYTPLVIKEDSIPAKTYIKCIGIDDNFDDEKWRLLLLEEYSDDSYTYFLGEGSWIDGLSSMNGFLYNNCFEVDGGTTKLLEVSDNEGIIYSNNQSGVSEITDSSNPDIKIDGLDVYISVGEELLGSLYSLSGTHIGNCRLSKTTTHIALPDKGIYILKIGNISRKILAF